MHLFAPSYPDPLEELFHADLPAGEPWGWLLAWRILNDQTLAQKFMAAEVPSGLSHWVGQELRRLKKERERLQEDHPFGDFGSRKAHPAEEAALEVLLNPSPELLGELYQKFGYGGFIKHSAFFYNQHLQPVARPDPSSFADLVGYTRQIGQLRRNVERFLAGRPSVPMLLYGARGSGKSSSVKALRTHYGEQGLKLVEVLAEGLERLPDLLELLRPLPYKFVLYLDDLALSTDDPRFHKLKALLEGAVFERPSNVLVVATSNRRNLVTQSFADRPEPDSTDPAAWDTLQDKLALADRFGLVLTFPPFNQAHYLEAVAHILDCALDEETRKAALQFALDGRGFSGRTARHFVNQFETTSEKKQAMSNER